MSYATVPAYHVFMAAKATMEAITRAMQQHVTHAAHVEQGRFFLFRNLKNRTVQAMNDMELARGADVGRIMNLAVAAMSVDPTAMVAIDEYDFELIREQFFEPRLTAEVRSHMAFVSMPGGHA